MSSYPTIFDPQPTIESVTETVRQLKMAIEQTSGQSGTGGGTPRRYVQADQPTDPKVGDLWADTSDAGVVRYWNGYNWVDISSSRFTNLEAKYEDALVSARAAIRRTETAYANALEAFAQVTETIEAYYNDNSAVIEEEKTVRATADSAQATLITNLTATVNTNNNNLTAAIQNEQIARVSGDQANAQSIQTLTSTVNGNTASITTLTTTTANINGALSASWSVQGNIDGVTGGLRLTGIKKADGTGATYNLIIDANTTINGNLLVNGTINTAAAADNAFTEGATGNGNGTASCSLMAKKAGDIFVVIGSYAGGSTSAANSFGFGSITAGNMAFFVNGFNFANVSIRGFMYQSSIFCLGGTCGLTNSYSTAPTTYTTAVAAGGAGLHTFNITTGLGELTTISVFRLSK